MSSIADALRRAQQERERLRGSATRPPAAVSAPPTGPSLASVVLRKAAPESKPDAPVHEALAAPLTAALEQQTSAPPPAVQRQQLASDTIIEDYQAKRRLDLPATIVVYHDRAGPVAQQFRDMRDRLMATNVTRDQPMLTFTSARRGEGKTTALLNLALALCEVRSHRVLLVDGCLGDGHRGPLSHVLHLHAERGASEFFAQPAEASTFVRPTPWHNLFVLPAGATTTASASAETLRLPSARTGLRQLRTMFDYVLIDAPAIDRGPDAGLLGTMSDGLVLVTAIGRTSARQVQTAVRRMASLNVPVKHAILTHAP